MVYRIINSPIARITFQQNIKYLEEEWTIKEILNFLKKTEEIIEILKKAPEIFQKWEHNETIQKIIVIKQVTLFYSIRGETVEILLFWNNYKDPNDLIKLL